MAWLESLGGDTGGGGSATPITPSNSSPAQMNNGETYEAQGDGLAIESLRSIIPSNSSPIVLTSGEIDKLGGNGYAIQSYNTKTVPSSMTATPVAVTSGEIDKIAGPNGYLISGYTSVSPSASGTYFESGMRKMSSSGYAYTRLPSLKATTLWTNPSTSTSSTAEFAAQDITLSQSITYFDYIGIYWEHAYGLATTSGISIWESGEIQLFSNNLNKGESSEEGFFGFYYRNSSSTSTYYWYLRNLTYNSNTSLHISNCWRMVMNTSGTNTKYNSRVIPKFIFGYITSA